MVPSRVLPNRRRFLAHISRLIAALAKGVGELIGKDMKGGKRSVEADKIEDKHKGDRGLSW